MAISIARINNGDEGCNTGAVVRMSFKKMADSPGRIRFCRSADARPLAISDGKMSGASRSCTPLV